MNKVKLRGLTAAMVIAASGVFPAFSDTTAHYKIVDRIAGPNIALWDYALIDADTRQLFLSTGFSSVGGVTVLDLDSRHVIGQFIADKKNHGFALLGNAIAVVAEGAQDRLRIFEEKSGKTVATVHTGEPHRPGAWRSPDSITLEPKTGLVVAANAESGTLSLIDVQHRVAVGSIFVGGKVEFSAARGDGTVFINVETKNAIAVVDIPQRKVLRLFALQECEGPTGLAYDASDNLVISVCTNGVTKFVDADSGDEVASVRVGKGADAVMFDARRHVAFIAAEEGTLSVIRVAGRSAIGLIQTLLTQPGTRLGAVDSKTGNLYLPSSRPDSSVPPIRLPGLPPLAPAMPGSFEILVISDRL